MIAACKDDMATKLFTEGKEWFAKMGSNTIFNVAYRQSFAFIGQIGRNQVNE